MRGDTPPGRLNIPPAIARGRGDWRDQALCRNATPALFDAEENDRRSNPRIVRAIEICEACPAIQDCLNDAMEHEGDARPANRHTIRGGTLPSERAAEYRKSQIGGGKAC